MYSMMKTSADFICTAVFCNDVIYNFVTVLYSLQVVMKVLHQCHLIDGMAYGPIYQMFS